MSYPHYDLVQRAHSELLTEGKIQPRNSEAAIEQDKGLLTRRAGYYSNSERDPLIGILEKNYGNQSEGYSVDILIHTDGTYWDVATDSWNGVIGSAQPANIGPKGPDPELVPRWRQPTAELAQIDSSTPGPGPGPSPSPDDDAVMDALDHIIEMLERAQEVHARDTAGIIARDDLNTQKVIDHIDHVVNGMNETLKKALLVLIARQEGGTEPPIEGEEPGREALIKLVLKYLADRPAATTTRGQ